MPFDGKNFTETKPAVVSLEGLIAWLREQDPATEYNFKDIRDCLLCRYFKAKGLTGVSVGGATYRADGQRGLLPYEMTSAVVRRNAFGGWDYGTALSRALALQAR